MRNIFLFILFGWAGLLSTAHAQIIQSEIDLTDYQRIQQLTDSTSDNNFSYTQRSASLYWLNHPDYQIKNSRKIQAHLLQIGYQQQYNSKIATSANDGSFIPALGMQHRLTVGALFRFKNLSIQLQPEFIQAANTAPQPFNGNPFDGNYFSRYYMYYLNKIDNLSQFGTASLSKFFPGQSSIRFNTNNLSIGISTENLWWGPARKNSLVMTNNAPGFLHGTIQSLKPIETKLGNVEFQVIYGSLLQTPFEPQDHLIMRNIWQGGIALKSTQSRNLFGYNISISPKGAENLFIGLTGAHYFYTDSANIQHPDIVRSYENKTSIGALGSLFVRYKMPNELAEVYAEYGRANQLAMPWNLIGDTIPTGYTIGFRKGFTATRKGQLWLSAELTQLQLPDARLIFDASSPSSTPKTNSWYTHPYITQGYTNYGQSMGAPMGPGSNSLFVELAWINGLKKLGLSIERIANNNDFALYTYTSGNPGQGLPDRYWINQSLSLQAQTNWGNWLIAGSLTSTKALNYRWVNLSGLFSQGSPDSDRTSVRAQISLIYFFKKPTFTP
jgi:hypothetical protein